MEQKRTLWIVAAAGVFLLVVVGAAVILYAPSNNADTVQSVYSVKDGFVNIDIPSYNKAPRSPFESQPPATGPDFSNDRFDPSASVAAANENAAPKSVTSDSLTVYSTNTTVYGTGTTTFDLNALKVPSQAESSVTAKNDYTANQISTAQSSAETAKAKPVTDDSYYTPAPKAKTETVAKAEVKSTKPAQAASTKKQTAKAQPKAKAAPKPADRFWVQAASYTNKKNADEARTTLESNKIPSEVFTYTDSKGKIYYRVRVGPYTTSSEAEYWQKRVAMIDTFASTPSYVVNSSAKAN